MTRGRGDEARHAGGEGRRHAHGAARRGDGAAPRADGAAPRAEDDAGAAAALEQVLALRADMLALERRAAGALEGLAGDRRESARNLIHYLALRSVDVRPLQPALVRLGLSSLGRCEGHALATVEAVARALAALAGREAPAAAATLGVEAAEDLLEARARDLLGPAPAGRRTRIVATLGAEATAGQVAEVVAAGADLVRLNCAHDGPADWARLARAAREAGAARGREVRVLVDLGGPKLRTAGLPDGPRVVTWRPGRDAVGRTVHPARVWLRPEGVAAAPPGPCDAVLPVPAEFLAGLPPGEAVRLVDSRGRRRRLTPLAEDGGAGRWFLCDRRAFVVPGTPLRVGRGAQARGARVGDLPPQRRRFEVSPGARLELMAGEGPWPQAADGGVRVGCTLPVAVRALQPGQRVLFDDGVISALVERADADGAVLRVTEVRPGAALADDKGINLPGLDLELPALTAQDEADLDVVAPLADLVGLSFVQTGEDVARAAAALAARGRPEGGLVLKVETSRAFAGLPRLLLAALRQPKVGVMIARGDLAVDIGFERLSEAQEELLWLCEAAHLPVVWATQVLEQMTKTGLPSRAEVTDAAAGERAEAVMLNKGKHQARATACLDDVLRRMQGHQHKKSALLRPLRLARDFFDDLPR